MFIVLVGFLIGIGIAMLALSLAGCAESDSVGWPAETATLTQAEVEEDAAVIALLQEIREDANRSDVCGPMLADFAEYSDRAYDIFYAYRMGDITKTKAEQSISWDEQNLENHGDACGEDATYWMGTVFDIYYGLLDNPTDAVIKIATFELGLRGERIVEAVSDYTGVSQ